MTNFDRIKSMCLEDMANYFAKKMACWNEDCTSYIFKSLDGCDHYSGDEKGFKECISDNISFLEETIPTKTVYYSTIQKMELPEDMSNSDIDDYIERNFPPDTMWSLSEEDFYN